MAGEGNATPPTGQGGTNEPGAERRAAPRLPSTLRVACYPTGAGIGERRQARVRNVSKTGIGLVVDRRWDAGTTLIVELPLGEVPRSVKARVIHVTALPGGLLLVGCVLEAALSDADVQALAR